MNHAQPFLADFARVCAATVFIVASIAFVSIPYALQGHPGEPVATAADRHLS